MILYLDSSSLAKLYIEEDGSPAIKQATLQAESLVSSLVAYAEVRAALARAVVAARITAGQNQLARNRLDLDWQLMAVSAVSADTVRARR